MAAGIRSVMPDAAIIAMPLADGGEGTMDVLQSQCGGDVRDNILYFKDNGIRCALIESARLIGLKQNGIGSRHVSGCGVSQLSDQELNNGAMHNS